MDTQTQRQIQSTLHKIFGIDSFRPGQRDVVEAALNGIDTIAVMPTGAGKSLCYQLPGLQLEGTTIVVSPLISLMKDQSDKLEALGLDAAAINSALSTQEESEALEIIGRRATEFVFATPERLAEPEFLQLLKRTPIDLFVIDEAHCISQWGHDFRPAFLEITTALRELGDPTVLALTATATQAVIDDIKTQLARPDMRVVNIGVYRPNLQFSVRQVTNEAERWAALQETVARRAGCGIVYCATVKAATAVHAKLLEAGERALVYHGRLASRARTQAQEAFMAGEAEIMVATNAFGMGIDKPDIRFVVHFQMPASLEAYYQEAGRAGRDGEDASCTLIYNHTDRRIHFFFLGGRYPGTDDFRAVHEAALSDVEQHRRVSTARMLQAGMPVSKRKAQVVLNLLKQAGLLGNPVEQKTLEELARSYRERSDNDRDKLERVRFYAHTALCRWKVMLEYFGETTDWERCGICDNCSHAHSSVPETSSHVSPAPKIDETHDDSGFRKGDYVQVHRFGAGIVDAIENERITVSFADGERREFLKTYVSRQPPGVARDSIE